MQKVLISHARLAASPLGPVFGERVRAVALCQDSAFVTVEREALERIVTEMLETSAADGEVRVCVRDLAIQARERRSPDFYFEVVAAGRAGRGCVWIDLGVLRAIQVRHPLPQRKGGNG